MQSTLKISARNAGQVELAKYCPRCAWYLFRLKKMPFQMGMPGVMFYLEQCEKAFILAHLGKYQKLPKDFGLFSRCTQPVEFPFRMSAEHKASGVILTAQVDMMLRLPDGKIALIDLKTAKSEGGGAMFHPQYEVQLIGYSWVTEAAEIGEVGRAGLIFCEIDNDLFKDEPLAHSDDDGIVVPFHFTAHPVALDFDRLTKCLKEMNRVWNEPRPPQGAENCKDCALLTRLFDFESEMRSKDAMAASFSQDARNAFIGEEYKRAAARGTYQKLQDALGSEDKVDMEGGMWANWDFTE